MFANPVIGILHNKKENRWHPIVFDESPMPGPHDPETMVRFRSKMHHTGGFATREEAATNAKGELMERLGAAQLAIDADLAWDGDGVPAITAFLFEGSLCKL